MVMMNAAVPPTARVGSARRSDRGRVRKWSARKPREYFLLDRGPQEDRIHGRRIDSARYTSAPFKRRTFLK